jgi:predicted molibdopterin-dependent oxidoreductase YjgC
MDDSMFNTDSADRTDTVKVTLDGQPVALPTDMTVAAALFSIGETISRVSPTSHKPCSPHCLMGVCFECMMEIDGVQRQACLTEVHAGMVISRHLNDDKGAAT